MKRDVQHAFRRSIVTSANASTILSYQLYSHWNEMRGWQMDRRIDGLANRMMKALSRLKPPILSKTRQRQPRKASLTSANKLPNERTSERNVCGRRGRRRVGRLCFALIVGRLAVADEGSRRGRRSHCRRVRCREAHVLWHLRWNDILTINVVATIIIIE